MISRSEGFDTLGPSIYAELAELCIEHDRSPSQHDSVSSVYFDKIGRVEKMPVYLLTSLHVSGPAVVTTRGLCIVLELGVGG